MNCVPLDEAAFPAEQTSETLLALDEALTRFRVEEPEAVKIVELQYFAGLSIDKAADAGVSLCDGQPPLGLRESLASLRASRRLNDQSRLFVHREPIRDDGRLMIERVCSTIFP